VEPHALPLPAAEVAPSLLLGLPAWVVVPRLGAWCCACWTFGAKRRSVRSGTLLFCSPMLRPGHPLAAACIPCPTAHRFLHSLVRAAGLRVEGFVCAVVGGRAGSYFFFFLNSSQLWCSGWSKRPVGANPGRRCVASSVWWKERLLVSQYDCILTGVHYT
jgi:hypothetical protein